MRGSLWFHLVYKSFIPHISYTRMHCGVPTASFAPFRTSEAPPVYQPCPPSLSVPHRGPSPVPNTLRSAVRTPEAHLLYRTRYGVRFVPQRPISCTEHVSECGSYPRDPSPVPNTFRSAVRTPEILLLYRIVPGEFSCLRKLDTVPGASQ